MVREVIPAVTTPASEIERLVKTKVSDCAKKSPGSVAEISTRSGRSSRRSRVIYTDVVMRLLTDSYSKHHFFVGSWIITFSHWINTNTYGWWVIII